VKRAKRDEMEIKRIAATQPEVIRVVSGARLPLDAIALLWGRGDEPAEIAHRCGISLATIEEAIRQYGHRYPKRPKRRSRRSR